ncbi:MAG: hypothetical protein EBZ77_07010 [Chitinophagia bacterium]|nr:hypothetical protein [Chitinophagia bacterium]
MTTDTDLDNLSAKIEFGFRLAARRLYEQAAANNECLVIADADGTVKRVSARELLDRQKQSAETEQYFKDGAAKYLIHKH